MLLNTKCGSATVVAASTRKPERQSRPGNVSGGMYVDHTCIDCDTCRWMAPQTFTRLGGKSAVTAQPAAGPERAAALQALLACPTFSIHVDDARPGELAAARDAFPLAVDFTSDVFHLGSHSQRSYGAASYLVTRAAGGNVMVDVPRWNPHLAQRLASLGGVAFMVLTHRDDVADHAAWAAHFGAQRIIHASEANRRQGTE
jgi:ferredoxin